MHLRVTNPAAAMQFFVGTWDLETEGPQTSIKATWTVTATLAKALCLSGMVQMPDGSSFTKEIIAYDAAAEVFVRTIASDDGSYFHFTAKGWEGDTLVWTGTQVSKTGQKIALKEEIRRTGTDSFTAEYFNKLDGNWSRLIKEKLHRH